MSSELEHLFKRITKLSEAALEHCFSNDRQSVGHYRCTNSKKH